MKTIQALDLSGPVVLGFGWRSGQHIETGRIDISNGLSDTLRAIADKHQQELMVRSSRPYSPEIDIVPHDEYASATTRELDGDDPTLALLHEAGLLDATDARRLPRRSLLYYAIVFPGVAAFVRKTNPYLSANRGRIFTRLANTLVEVEEPLFAFDRTVDFVITPDAIYISSLNAFEYLFKDDAYITRNIPIWIGAITSSLDVAAGGVDVLEKHCRSNTRLRRRLESIAARHHLAKVTATQLRKEMTRLALDPTKLMKGSRLVISDDTVADVLKLLNEDLFVGGLSGAHFEVDKKAPR